MSARKGVRPEQYAGVFHHYEDIPERYRLQTYADQYDGEDTLGQYVENVLHGEGKSHSETFQQRTRRAVKSWRKHMDDRGRHHALATPDDVEAWCGDHLSRVTRETAYMNYYVRIYQFYEHLVTTHHHPHVYNPFIIAAIEGGDARELWKFRVDNRPEVVDRE